VIPRDVAAAFPASVRARGDEYFAQGRVQLVRADSADLNAVVRGSTRYPVRITARKNLLTAACACPFAVENGICKHIWAVLRFAEKGQELQALTRTSGKNPGFVALSDDEEESMFDEGLADDNLYADSGDSDFDEFDPPMPDLWAPAARTGLPNQPAPSRHGDGGRSRRPPVWKTLIERAGEQMAHRSHQSPSQQAWPSDRRIVYIVDFAATWVTNGIVIDLATERLKHDGTWDAPAQFRLPFTAWQTSPDALDRQISQMLIGAPQPNPYGGTTRPGPFILAGPSIGAVLPVLCETGRCRVRWQSGERPVDPVSFDDGPPWRLVLRMGPEPTGEFVVSAVFKRPNDEMPIDEPRIVHSAGVLFAREAFAQFDDGGAFALVPIFREKQPLRIPATEFPAFLETLHTLKYRPELELPPETRVTESRAVPQPGVVIHPDPSPWRKTHHRLEPFFQYGSLRVAAEEPQTSTFDRETLTLHHRDPAQERMARERLVALGAKEEWHYGLHGKCLAIHANKLARLISDLAGAGWRVESDGSLYRAARETYASVRSGIDWFELSAGVRFGNIEVSLHDLIAARRSGATTIDLPDGSRGVIPSEWIAKLAPLVTSGRLTRGTLRFTRSQTALLDALLAAVPEPDVDAAFERARSELRSFDRVAPADPPASFCGTLREYQREGLGWLHFLRSFGFGGCLADDMGLGKTIQVLALLESRRIERETGTDESAKHPSIVVVPRSLVFNWIREAERFAPALRVVDYTGTTRNLDATRDGDTHVILTTYGTLRRDAAALADVEFDYAILDEAQAIKTAASASAKAARLLRARHRLAMTGTPIENRLEELWSLFEFLNPGMLGASTTFSSLVKLARSDAGAAAADRGVLAHALRPLILRRTKAQVASELPARVEQTLYVDLEGAQRKFYDDLLEAYRRSVLERVDEVGIGKARMHILEALLRLRQAACHPALADPRKTSAPSAKLDALIPTLEEVAAEGHKALVFSQFTSLLDLVRARLDAAGTVYEYLDGKTRDRQARVDRFQNDPACPLFLISLKAGGHGLNLTAAEYVYILDPWWNPAVEAQAVDRAHRIGQTKQVMATRIVARDTIEEKILELQASKRALAEAILGQDQGVLAQIGRAELELLLSTT
jgi:superfamily II DNA or RNA helicase